MAKEKQQTYILQENKISIHLLTHILLTVCLGIFWILIWIYKTTTLLNNVKGESQRKPSSCLILSIFVPFYMVIWFRKTAQIIEFLGNQAKLPISFSGVCTFFALCFPPLSSILIEIELERLTGLEFRSPSYPNFIPKPAPAQKADENTTKLEIKSPTPVQSIQEEPEEEPFNDIETEIETTCPFCKETLYFMGSANGDHVSCPFCDNEFTLK